MRALLQILKRTGIRPLAAVIAVGGTDSCVPVHNNIIRKSAIGGAFN
jgi:hypothetical protein